MGKAVFLDWVLCIFLLIFATATFFRNGVWLDEFTLWNDVAYKSPGKATPHVNLANELERRGAHVAAEREFREALKVNSLDSRAINGLAVIYFRQERYDEATRLFRILAEEKPNEPYFQNNLGVALMRQNRLDEAAERFQAAIRLLPGFADAYSNEGVVYRKLGLPRKAEDAFRKALALNPEHAGARLNLQELEALGWKR